MPVTSSCTKSGGNTDLICTNIDNKYIINDSNATITKIKADYNDKIVIINNEISLTPASSNHYFYADEKAHCSETWQDWFCIPNYHNNNKVNKYPLTKTMSVGGCYDYCGRGSSGKYMTIKNKTKCEVYDENDDFIYNPLAIIAMLGTHFNDTEKVNTHLQELTTLKYIGFRGSYFNDLYRVNKNDNFITNTIINEIKGGAIPITITNSDNYQDKLLASIIKGLYSTRTTNTTILLITRDIKKAIKTITDFYISGKNPEKKEMFFKKISEYVIDIDKLENAYGNDKNGKEKFINIIAYTYNIMYSIFYDTTKTPPEIRKRDDINTRIGYLIDSSSYDSVKENKDDLIKMFQYACYNCFNVNFNILKAYIDDNPYNDALLRIDIDKDGSSHISKQLNTFSKAIIDIDGLSKGTIQKGTYDLSYNINYYKHSILAEYGGHEKNLNQILIVFALLFACVLIVSIVYCIFAWRKMDNNLIAFFNFSFLFYKMATFGTLRISCIIYYHILSKLSKYSITSILFKIFNIGLIIFLIGYLYKIVTELLSFDYITLLNNMDYSDPSKISPEDRGKYSEIVLYLFIMYLIYIYIYSVYIIRYSLNETKFDIMANIDADDRTALEFVENELELNYLNDLIAIFTSLQSASGINQEGVRT